MTPLSASTSSVPTHPHPHTNTYACVRSHNTTPTHLAVRADSGPLIVLQLWVNLPQDYQAGVKQPPAGPGVTSKGRVGAADFTGLVLVEGGVSGGLVCAREQGGGVSG